MWRLNRESFLSRRLTEPVVQTDKLPLNLATIAPYQGRRQLQGICSTQGMHSQEAFCQSPHTSGRLDFCPAARQEGEGVPNLRQIVSPVPS
jgi:hypothetical protein